MLAPHDAPADTPHHRPCHRSHPQQPRTPQPQTRPPRQPHQPQPPDQPHHHDHRQHLDAPSSPTPHSPGNQEQPHPNPPTPPQNENRDNPTGIPIETLQTICSQNFRSSMTTTPDRIQAARRIGLSCTSRTTPSSDSRRNVSLVQKCPTRGPDDRARRRRTDLDAEPDRSRAGTRPISTTGADIPAGGGEAAPTGSGGPNARNSHRFQHQTATPGSTPCAAALASMIPLSQAARPTSILS